MDDDDGIGNSSNEAPQELQLHLIATRYMHTHNVYRVKTAMEDEADEAPVTATNLPKTTTNQQATRQTTKPTRKS